MINKYGDLKMPTCLFCQRLFSNAGGLGGHVKYCKKNPNCVPYIRPLNAGLKKGSIPWNKGLIGDIRCKKSEEEKLSRKGKSSGKCNDPDKELIRIEKIRAKALITHVKNGGYRQGSGRGKKGWYKGFFCDSSWELAYVVYCLEHNIDIKRNTAQRKYIWEGKTKNYIPDFIVDGTITEIKGYKSEQWIAKLEANPDITVLYQRDMESILTYVCEKYGKDFIKLYEQ